MGVVTGNQYEVGDRFNQLKIIGMPSTKWGKPLKQYLHQVYVFSTGLLFQVGSIVSKLAYASEVRNYGKSFIYQVQTIFLAINIFQRTNNPFPGAIFKQALQ